MVCFLWQGNLCECSFTGSHYVPKRCKFLMIWILSRVGQVVKSIIFLWRYWKPTFFSIFLMCKISLCALVDSMRAEYIYTLVLVWMQLPIFESVGAFYLVAPWPLFKCNICERRRDPLPDIDMPTTYYIYREGDRNFRLV